MSIIKPHIQAMSAYSPPLEGRNPEANLLLDFNERTLPVSEPIIQALVDYIHSGRLQMYPSYGDVVERIAAYAEVKPERLMITNGSDQGIDLIFRSVCSAGDEAIIPAPNFAMYKQCAGIENLTVIEPHYTRENGFPVDEVLAAISSKTKIICISNPCNPSGTVVASDAIFRIAQAAPAAAILVDECYYEYSGLSVADAVEQYPNIVITRTFSKTWGIPSLRLGYIVASSEVVTALLNVRGPYDINQLAVEAVKAALAHPEYTHAYVREVMDVSKPRFEAWLTAQNIMFWPSQANYVWAFPDNAEAIGLALQQQNILVRPKKDAKGKLGLRITLGNEAQTEKLITEFAKLLAD